MMNSLAKELLNSGIVLDRDGNSYELTSSIDKDEGEFLQNLIRNNNLTQSLEVGCAYGISSLFICNALSDKTSAHHIIIDPYQTTQWHGIGISNLEKAGFNFFHLIEKPSEIALPELLTKGDRFDFAFIDGWHTFDHTLLDFFYVNRLLRVGGIVAIDDATLPGVGKALHYILNYPNYEVIGSAGKQKERWKRKLVNVFKKGIHTVAGLIPNRLASEIFDASIVSPEPGTVHGASMVALRKIDDDKREWNWYVPF